jgi:CDP-diacylglycerol--serine O-phosphatidyltransferase
MQDEKPQTTNNMQADEHSSPEITEVSLAPGPSIFNWRKVLPNSLTILATVVGLSAFRFALDGSYELGVLCILAAGMLDGLDGPVARAVNGTSRFGAELDSLSGL